MWFYKLRGLVALWLDSAAKAIDPPDRKNVPPEIGTQPFTGESCNDPWGCSDD